MLCRFKVTKAIQWSVALAFILAGTIVLCTMGSSLAVVAIGIILIGGGFGLANATLIEDDIRYRRQYD